MKNRKNSPERPKTSKTAESQKKPGNLKLVLSLAAGLSAVAAINMATKDKTRSVITTTSQTTPAAPGAKIDRIPATPENLANYTPPKEGKITKKNFFPGVKKTVIFVPEMHKTGNSIHGVSDDEGLQANMIHEAKFAIIADLIQRFGKMPIVDEGWTTENDRMDIATIPNFQQKTLLKLMMVDDWPTRIDIGRQMAATTSFPATIALLAVFRGELIPIGTTNRNEQAEVKKMVKELQVFQDLYTTPNPVCEGAVSKKKMTPKEVDAAFKKGEKDDVLNCYCTLHLAVEQADAMFEKRMNVTSLKELGIALKLPEDVMILSSGALHNKKAIEELEKTKTANYMVISSEILEQQVGGDIKENEEDRAFQDTPDHVCENLKKSDAESLQKNLKAMLEKATK